MRVPISWLQEYVAFEDTIEGLTEKLTFSGLEVEAIEKIGGSLEGVVAAKALAVDPHPNADRLRLVTVDHGQGTQQVVCGAPNVEVGGSYAYAPIGVTLPNGMKLKKAKIRGIVSEGMLCAEDELGLSEAHEGLLELDTTLAAGTPLAEVLGPPETVLEIEVTPNRPDSLCMLGIAREMAALYGLPLQRPDISFEESEEAVETWASVDLQDDDGCPRYTARVMRNVRIGPSPDWMQKRLSLAGVRPINLAVDITNYVMLEMGQPQHAFDLNLLAGKHICIRRATEGEGITTLDEAEHKLDPATLVIADAEKPVAVAGVMGGIGSEIRDDTTDVLLESAAFRPDLIRHTAKRLTLHSESSYRYARRVDPAGADTASRRAAHLFARYAGATICKGVLDAYPNPEPERRIVCRWDRLNTVLGVEVDPQAAQDMFARLELDVLNSDDTSCTVRAPSFRPDLEREVDLVEEVARMQGLDRIPAPAPCATVVPDVHDDPVRARRLLRRSLQGLGFSEIMNYSLTAPKLLDLYDPNSGPDRIVLPHPISADQSVLRNSLVPQMLDTLGRNHARQVPQCCFFELGRSFHKAETGSSAEETETLCMGISGPVGRRTLDAPGRVSDQECFLWIKGAVEQLCILLGLSALSVEPLSHPAFEKGRLVTLRTGKGHIGFMGLIRQSLREEWRMNEPVAAAELSVSRLLSRYGSIDPLQPVASYPAVERDWAFIVDESVSNADILAAIKKSAPKDLEKVRLFDIFRGEALGKGKKSMAYSLVYRSQDKTLTDDVVNGFHERIRNAVVKEVDATIRGE